MVFLLLSMDTIKVKSISVCLFFAFVFSLNVRCYCHALFTNILFEILNLVLCSFAVSILCRSDCSFAVSASVLHFAVVVVAFSL